MVEAVIDDVLTQIDAMAPVSVEASAPAPEDAGSLAPTEGGVPAPAEAGAPAPIHDVPDSDEQYYSQTERLVRAAVFVYRSRGYNGTITIAHKVGIFTETVSIQVRPSSESDNSPTPIGGPAATGDGVGGGAGVEPTADIATEGAPDMTVGGTAGGAAVGDAALMHSENAKVGRLFEMLLGRLERRAASWDAMDHDLDPVLGASATLGFAMPFIKVGWGITVSLSITKSSLLRWARGVSLPQAPNGCPRVGKRFHTPDSACSSAFAASDAVLIAEDL